MRVLLCKFFIIVLCTAVGHQLTAQHNPVLHGDTIEGLYILYKIQKKDNLFAIGHKYGLRYQEIMDFNNMAVPDISVGQEIEIPIKRENFVNADVVISDELMPLVHKTKRKEGLYRIGISHYKTPIRLLMKWNSLKNYDIKVNQEIIVGYVKSADATIEYIGSPSKFEGKPYIPPLRSATSQNKKLPSSSKVSVPVAKVADKVSASSINKAPSSYKTPSVPVKKMNKGAGFFEKIFSSKWQESTNGQKTKSFLTGAFNSNSGWNDNKYYAMSSSIPAQSVVRIRNVETNQTIYAKVLGTLPSNFKQKGFKLILSSAGAAELGLDVGKSLSTECTY